MIHEIYNGFKLVPIPSMEELHTDAEKLDPIAILKLEFGYIFQDKYGEWRDHDGVLPRSFEIDKRHPAPLEIKLAEGRVQLTGLPELTPDESKKFGEYWDAMPRELGTQHHFHPEQAVKWLTDQNCPNPKAVAAALHGTLRNRGIISEGADRVLTTFAPEISEIQILRNGRKYRLTPQGEYQGGEYPSGGIKIQSWEPRLNQGQGTWIFIDHSPDEETLANFLKAAAKLAPLENAPPKPLVAGPEM